MRKVDLIAAREESKITPSIVNGIKVVDVTLTQASHHLASKYGVATHEVNNANRASGYGPTEVFKGKTTLDTAEFEVAGKEGELAASIYLMGNDWSAIQRWVIGTGDSGDLAFWQKGQQKIIDVKIRTKPEHTCFKLTLKQWRNHYPDYYVSTQYPNDDREKVRIWGYVERRKIDALVIAETKRILGKPLKWDYLGTGAQKHVRMTNEELDALAAELEKSPELGRLPESEINCYGIGELDGYGPPVIAIPFTLLSPIEELRKIISS
jgi:hypothetical protein